jgi:hypothetical protein
MAHNVLADGCKLQLARYESDGDWSACMQRWVESFGDVTYVADDECPLYNAGRWCNLNESHLRKLTHEEALPYCQFVLRKARVKKVRQHVASCHVLVSPRWFACDRSMFQL